MATVRGQSEGSARPDARSGRNSTPRRRELTVLALLAIVQLLWIGALFLLVWWAIGAVAG